MKKLLLLVISLTTVFAKAQTSVYHPFPEDSATWCEWFCSIQPPPFPHYWYGDATSKLDGKILINGNWYSRMLHYSRSCQASPTWCLCAVLNSEGIGTYYIRQDTAQKKVWLYVPSTNSDTTFLDFNLHVGDTIDGRNAYWAQQMGSAFSIVDSIDSVLIGTQYRTRYIYLYGGFPNTMIEGIGPDHGLFNGPNQGFEYHTELSLFSQNNQILFPFFSADTTHCYDFTSGIEEPNPIAYSISPNPSSDELRIHRTKASDKEMIQILNYTGQVFYDNTNFKGETVDTRQLPNGVYLLKYSDGKNFSIERFAVQH